MTLKEQIASYLITIAENVQKVFNSGKQAEIEEYWTNFWAGSNGTYLNYFFAGGGWNIETFSKIIYPDTVLKLKGNTGAAYMFIQCNRSQDYKTPLIDLTEFCKHIDCSEITSASNMFYNARVKNITLDLSKCTNMTNAFGSGNGGVIENITINVTDKVTTWSGTFNYQYDLTKIIFVEGSQIAANISFPHSANLTDESIDSIIAALKNLTGATSKTLTVHATVYDKMVASGKDALVTAKNWSLVKAS